MKTDRITTFLLLYQRLVEHISRYTHVVKEEYVCRDFAILEVYGSIIQTKNLNLPCLDILRGYYIIAVSNKHTSLVRTWQHNIILDFYVKTCICAYTYHIFFPFLNLVYWVYLKYLSNIYPPALMPHSFWYFLLSYGFIFYVCDTFWENILIITISVQIFITTCLFWLNIQDQTEQPVVDISIPLIKIFKKILVGIIFRVLD